MVEFDGPPRPRVVLLLPATVNTGSTPYISPRDPGERLAQYRDALADWIGFDLGIPIVVAENSGADLSDLQAVVDDSGYGPGVELISFADNQMAQESGKGQGEVRTIEYALAHSAALAAADLVWKVTGRYVVRNARALLNRTVRHPWEGVHFDLLANLTFADTRCFFAHPAFLSDFLVPRRHEINDLTGVYMEHAAARALHAAMALGWAWHPLAVSPNLHGTSGTFGRSYRRSRGRQVADAARRRLLLAMLARG